MITKNYEDYDFSEEVGQTNMTIWKPQEIGEYIIGKFLKKEEHVGTYQTPAYILEDSQKNKHIVYEKKVLIDKMKHINPGDVIKVVWKGKTQGEKNSYDLYNVFKGKPKTITTAIDEQEVYEKYGNP